MPKNRKPASARSARSKPRPSVKDSMRSQDPKRKAARRPSRRVKSDDGGRERQAPGTSTREGHPREEDLSSERSQRASLRDERKGRRGALREQAKRAEQREQLRTTPRPSLAHEDEERFESLTLDVEGRRITLTRRHFLYGAIGAGAAALMAAGATLSDSGEGQGADGIRVSERSVSQLDDLAEASRDDCFTMIAEHTLPYGTLVWSNSDDIACCLIPTNQPSPLTQVSALLPQTGIISPLLEGATGAAEGYEVIDARVSPSGLIWTEGNATERTWRVLCAPLTDAITLQEGRVLDEGGAEREIPAIAAVGDCAWWQTMPSVHDEKAAEKQSALMRARFAGGEASCVRSAQGRMACPPCPCPDGIVIAAREGKGSRTFVLLKFQNDSDAPVDSLQLPSGMAPCALGWGPNGFSFCFDGIYDYGGGISNLGTYTPASPHKPGSSYDDLSWFRFGRVPATGPFWCGEKWFMVKSTRSVCGVNIGEGTYCSLDVESGCTDWGDHLCSTGFGAIALSAMQVNGDATLVRVWQPNSDLYA